MFRFFQGVFKGRFDRASLVQSYSRAPAPTGKDVAKDGKSTLNPMQFYDYNVKYFGFEDWMSKHPELELDVASIDLAKA